MSEQILSPGEFNTENDQSYMAPQTAEPGAAVVGPTTKGPAFIPTVCTSYNDYVLKFGPSDGNTYVPYVVRNYLKNSSAINVTRILGLEGYKHDNAAVFVASSSFGQRVIGVLHHTTKSVANTSGSFEKSTLDGGVTPIVFSPAMTGSLKLSGSFGITTSEDYTVSPFTDSPNYLGKVFGRTPVSSKSGYLYSLFTNYSQQILSSSAAPIAGTITLDVSSYDLDFSSTEYSSAYTPWITSQKVGSAGIELFRFKTISHGEYINTAFKISIANIKKYSEVPGSNYGSFSILIRDINDTDRSPLILEQFNNVNLDPDSPNYIERIIGDKTPSYSNGKLIYTGDYPNLSDYVSVEVTEDVKNKSISTNLNPWGFQAVVQPFVLGTNVYFPTASMVTDQVYNSQYNEKVFYGYNFDLVNTDNKEYLKPIPEDAVVGLNVAFNLDNYTVNASNATYGGNSFATDPTPVSARKFNVPLQGGFGGMDPAISKNMGANINEYNTMGFDISSATSNGYVAYDRAITLLENKDVYDINAIFTPGVIKSQHSALVARIIDMVETRNDVFYPFDGSEMATTSLDTVVNDILTIDSSYAATYFPWVKQFDADLNKYIWVPPTVAFAEVIAYNDAHGYQWTAPAGLIRGGITSAVDVYLTLKQTERDVLYQGRVNPIAIFPNEGINIWGQKTLQAKPSALDRINVRRLLINLKKYFTKTGRRIVFEQNTAKTRTNFTNQVTPYMENVKQNQGLYVFKIVMDETNNTADVIDRNMLVGKVYLQPTKTAEFIVFEFNVTPTGASFSV